jgi:predicted DNA-binding transcriptional regulator YafY
MSELDRDIMRVLPDAGTQDTYLTTPEIHRRITQDALDPVTVRTVNRHLMKLEASGVVEVRGRGVALEWRRKAGASGMATRAAGMMTFDEALALQTLRRFSSRQIPELVADTLSSMFDVAKARLERTNNPVERRYARWASKVAVESGGFTLEYPAIDREWFAAVSRALFEERKLEIIYRPRNNASNETPRTILPLGLVEVSGLVYLIGATQGKPEPTMYRLDRIWRARAQAESFEYPPGFSLDEYVKKQRRFDFMVEKEVLLKLKFINEAGDHLLEAPMAKDQKTSEQDGALYVQGTVMLSQRLRWWLRSFGPRVEVLGPASLRTELAAEAAQLARMYGA